MLKNTVASDSFSISRSTGDVILDHCDAGQITVKTSTGDVSGTLLTEKIFIARSSTGSIHVPDTAAGEKCQITTSTGDINIRLKWLNVQLRLIIFPINLRALLCSHKTKARGDWYEKNHFGIDCFGNDGHLFRFGSDGVSRWQSKDHAFGNCLRADRGQHRPLYQGKFKFLKL